jgi:hypothetical protein
MDEGVLLQRTAEAYCLVNTCSISYKRIEAVMQQVVHSMKR